jgi:sulfite exporter TauE/SafE
MSWTEAWLAALVLGLASLPHCFAMCGPLAASGCSKKGHAIGYLAGRIFGYAAVGSVLGAAGAGIIRQVGDAQTVGRWSLLGLAAVCVVQAARAFAMRKARADGAKLAQLRRPTSSLLASLIPRRGMALGIVTAIFPCGALLAAWTLAAASAHPVSGAGAMFVFAVASTPSLVAAIIGRDLIAKTFANIPKPMLAIAWLSVAALLVGRAWPASSACH